MYARSITHVTICAATLLLVTHAHAKIVEITTTNPLPTTTQPVVIKFAADWCSACHHIDAPFAQISDEPEFQHIIFAHVDIDHNKELAKKYKIIGVPTLIYLQDGIQKDQSVGIKDVHSFKNNLRESICTNFNVTCKQAPVHTITKEFASSQNTPHDHDATNILQWLWNSIMRIFNYCMNMIKRLFV